MQQPVASKSFEALENVAQSNLSGRLYEDAEKHMLQTNALSYKRSYSMQAECCKNGMLTSLRLIVIYTVLLQYNPQDSYRVWHLRQHSWQALSADTMHTANTLA